MLVVKLHFKDRFPFCQVLQQSRAHMNIETGFALSLETC